MALAAAFAPERAIVAATEPLRPGRGMVIAPDDLRELVDHCLAAGYRVRLAATAQVAG